MTTPRRADARRGFLFASIRSPRTRCKVGRVGHVAACLTMCYCIIVPDGGTRSRTSSPPQGGDYTFFAAVRLALCSRLPISISLPSAQARAPADAGAQAFSARGQAQRMQREHAGHEQRGSRRRGEASPCADVRGGWGGAYDIGRDGTSSGGRAQARSCGRAQTGGDAVGRAHNR